MSAPSSLGPARRATLDAVLAGLMRRYRERVPDVSAILTHMVREGLIQHADEIENDHVAFRTLGVPQLGVASLERIFLHLGYTRQDTYLFEQKKLDACWYSPPEQHDPRIFISELRVGDLSLEAQAIITSYTDEVRSDPVLALDLDDARAVDAFLHSPLWRLPTWADYTRLQEESEYAAWAIYNRYYLNHFTVSVHNLPAGYDTAERFNLFLKARGLRLNESGGEVKVSPDGLLRQSSTVAPMVEALFAGGERRRIAGSYVEFAERRPLPQYAHLAPEDLGHEHRRDGFEAANADRIFESTYSAQTGR